jgi:outer membrane protein OmpA-like peptidoglycan-associated protein
MNRSVGTGWAVGLAVAAALVASAPVAAAQTLTGLITARDGAQMTVKATDGTKTVVTLTDSTRVSATSRRFLGEQSDDMAVTDLIEGLPVKVTTEQNGSEIDAVKVTFKASDLKTAQQVEAGTSTLKAENEKLKARLAQANEYVVKAQTTVQFATGSAVIPAKGKSDLKAIATQAKTIKGYLIGVTGHADTTGDSEKNQALSEKRAEAVIRYLQKYCGIQTYRVLSSGAMGQEHPVGENETAEGRALNRRVEVHVMVNKGLEGA